MVLINDDQRDIADIVLDGWLFGKKMNHSIPYIKFQALVWLRGTDDVKTEMDEIIAEHESMKQLPKVTFKEMLLNSSLRSPLIISMMMMLAQQLSGRLVKLID